MKWMGSFFAFLFLTLNLANSLTAAEPNGEASKKSLERVRDYFDSFNTPGSTEGVQTSERVYSPHEGVEYVVFNSKVKEWVKMKWDLTAVKSIHEYLHNMAEKPLFIPLTERGFARAANRSEGEKDPTNYSAIWVRDAVWVYYAIVDERPEDAAKLILALWDYYSTPHQWQRIFNIMRDPSRATAVNPNDYMDVPHIRFDGDDPELKDVQVCDAGGQCKDQLWNHKQTDAHAMFITAVLDSVRKGLLKNQDISHQRVKSLMLLVHFLRVTKYYDYADAGAWEETPRINSSSIGLAANSFRLLYDLMVQKRSQLPLDERISNLRDNAQLWGKRHGLTASLISSFQDTWRPSELKKQYEAGLDRVNRQLRMGGESPDYDPFKESHLYREADIALAHLVVPGIESSLLGSNPALIRSILVKLETLRRPAGILRYPMDSYQSGNYWTTIHRGWDGYLGTEFDNRRPNDPKIIFLTRFFSPLISDSEAQWFFDSTIAMLYLRLYEIEPSGSQQKLRDLHKATIHLKRALSQFTGSHAPARPDVHAITANGMKVKPWLLPESVNTLVVDGKRHLVPSPIVPLNWAKASLSMAFDMYLKVVGRE